MQTLPSLRLLVVGLLAVFVLAGCGGATSGPAPMAMATSAPAAGGATANESEASALEEAPAPAADGAYQEPAQAADPANSAQNVQRLVIKNAMVSLEVERVAEAEARIRARADQLGGYVVSVETRGGDEYQISTIVFRVPAERFEDALSGVEGLAREVLSRSVSGEDVTEEFVDLQSQLRNLDATRTRLLDLLTKATRVEDALSVNQALTEVQGQIEQIQGRLQYLQQSAAFSTISAELQPVPPPPTIIEEDGWQPITVARQALRGLVEFGQGLLSLAIVFAIWSPVWLPLLLLGRWGWRRIARRAPATKLPPPPPPAPSTPSTPVV